MEIENLNMQCFKEVKWDARKYFDLDKNTNILLKCVGCSQSIFRGNFITSNAYIKKEEMFQINDLSFHLKKTNKGQDFHIWQSEELSKSSPRKYKVTLDTIIFKNQQFQGSQN